jgi:hypothetical protein
MFRDDRLVETARRARWNLLAAITMFALLAAPAPAAAHGPPGHGGGEVTGPITSLPATPGWIGDWTVGVATVHVTSTTAIDQSGGAVAVGAIVAVKGSMEADGSIDAASIQVKAPAPGAKARVTVTGTIDALPSGGLIGDWTVSGSTVHVGDSTKINQSAAAAVVGAPVVVVGTLQADQSINAEIITVKPVPPGTSTMVFVGVVQTLPGTADFTGDWLVDTVMVHVTASTVIDQSKGTVAIGVLVKVSGSLETDGSIDAASIEVLPAAEPPGGGASHVFAVLALTPTADAPEGAEGLVVTRRLVFPDQSVREDVKVMVDGLLPATAYDVTIDTIAAGTIMTDDDGEGQLFLSTASIPGAEPLPPELQPVTGLQQITITDPATVVILTGDFADAMINSGEKEGLSYAAIAPLDDVSGDLTGLATAAIRGTDQMFSVAALGLMPGATVHIVVDGTDLGGFSVGGDGGVRLVFDSSPDADQLQLPDALVPVSGLLHVEIQDTDGNVIASGDFTVVNAGVGFGPSVMGALRRHLRGHH